MLRLCVRYVYARPMFWAYVALTLGVSLASLITPLLTGRILNDLIVTSFDMGSIGALCALLVAFGAGRALLSYASEILYIDLQAHSGFSLNAETIAHIQRLPQSFFAHFDPAYYNQQVNRDANDVVIFAINVAAQAGSNAVALIAVCVVLCALNARLGITCLALSMLSCALYVLFRHELFRRNFNAQEQLSKFFSCLQDQLDKIAFLRQHVLFQRFNNALERRFEGVYEALLTRQRAEARFALGNQLVTAAAQGCVFLVGAYEVMNGRLLAGYLVTAISYFSTFSTSVQYFLTLGKEYQAARVNYERLHGIWEIPEEPNGSLRVECVGEIECRDVRFTYPGAELPAFSGVHVHFERGKMYGVAGANGAGKSTFLRVLTGMLPDGASGSILYDGQPLELLDAYGLRAHCIGMTEQEPPIVDDTVYANMALLAPDADSHEVSAYVDALGLRPMIDAAPQGMQTRLDGRQLNLSGGEKQKLAIIRQLLKNPDVMLFDEPTSAMDAQSRMKFMRLLREKRADHIIVIVTHDREMLDMCDEVLELGAPTSA